MEAQASCDPQAGKFVPVVSRAKCENKGACVRVCPYGVFVIREVEEKDKRALGGLDRIKLWVHGGKQAYVDFADRCHACGLCVVACPEHAIRLQRVRQEPV